MVTIWLYRLRKLFIKLIDTQTEAVDNIASTNRLCLCASGIPYIVRREAQCLGCNDKRDVWRGWSLHVCRADEAFSEWMCVSWTRTARPPKSLLSEAPPKFTYDSSLGEHQAIVVWTLHLLPRQHLFHISFVFPVKPHIVHSVPFIEMSLQSIDHTF